MASTGSVQKVRLSSGLLFAVGLVAVATLVLALPGVLGAVPTTTNRPALEGAEAAIQAKITAAMREKVDRARAALDGANCTPDGQMRTGANAEPTPSLGPVKPERADAARPGGLPLVAGVATQSVVLVFALVEEAGRNDVTDPNKAKVSQGSGFFISPNTVITNAHVIDKAQSILVTNRFLGRVQPAKLLARIDSDTPLGADFAVLRVDPVRSVAPVPLSGTATRLMNVVAAGYPGIITQLDPQYAKLIEDGDMTAAPEVTTFPGYILVSQEENGTTSRIIHSATLAHGNSGGPLLDLCGRAIGVNTAKVTRDTDIGYVVNSALTSSALMAFLDKERLSYTRADDACSAPPPASPGLAAAPPSAAPADRRSVP